MNIMKFNNTFEVVYLYSILRILHSRLSINNFEYSTSCCSSFCDFFKRRWKLTHVESNNNDAKKDGENNSGSIFLFSDPWPAVLSFLYTVGPIPKSQSIRRQHCEKGCSRADSSKNTILQATFASLN